MLELGPAGEVGLAGSLALLDLLLHLGDPLGMEEEQGDERRDSECAGVEEERRTNGVGEYEAADGRPGDATEEEATLPGG